MPPSKTSFITGCQQFLALAVVLAALGPAASVVSLDVVRETPDGAPRAAIQGDLAAYTRVAHKPMRVPTEPVDPTVREFSLTAPAGAAGGSARLAVLGGASARGKVGALPADGAVTSQPETVTGFGTVGVTWAHGEDIPDGDIAVEVRTRTGDSWTDWSDLEYQ